MEILLTSNSTYGAKQSLIFNMFNSRSPPPSLVLPLTFLYNLPNQVNFLFQEEMRKFEEMCNSDFLEVDKFEIIMEKST